MDAQKQKRIYMTGCSGFSHDLLQIQGSPTHDTTVIVSAVQFVVRDLAVYRNHMNSSFSLHSFPGDRQRGRLPNQNIVEIDITKHLH